MRVRPDGRDARPYLDNDKPQTVGNCGIFRWVFTPAHHIPFAPYHQLGFPFCVMDAATKVLGKALVASPERRQEADADLEIVRQVQAGDVAAFDRLISKYRERVFGIVYNMTSN